MRQRALSGALAQPVNFYSGAMPVGEAAPTQPVPTIQPPAMPAMATMSSPSRAKKGNGTQQGGEMTPTEQLPTGLDMAGGPAYG